MSDFMVPQWERTRVYLIETSFGTECVPYDVAGQVDSMDDLREYLQGEPDEDEKATWVVKWIGRLSAPGYLDCTDWTWADSEEDVLRDLLETHGDCDDGADWPDDVRARLAEIEQRKE